MDTIVFQGPSQPGQARFGWQFRPVLERPTVTAGKRHLIVVLALPASDYPNEQKYAPELVAKAVTSWQYYDSKLQTTFDGHWWSHALPSLSAKPQAYSFEVPSIATMQGWLGPKVTDIN